MRILSIPNLVRLYFKIPNPELQIREIPDSEKPTLWWLSMRGLKVSLPRQKRLLFWRNHQKALCQINASVSIMSFISKNTNRLTENCFFLCWDRSRAVVLCFSEPRGELRLRFRLRLRPRSSRVIAFYRDAKEKKRECSQCAHWENCFKILVGFPT